MAATRAQVETYRQAQADTVDLAVQELMAFWLALDLSNPAGAIAELEDFLPDLIQAFGEIGAAVAADFYDELREADLGFADAYDARLADVAPLPQIRGSLRWAARPLFDRVFEETDDDGDVVEVREGADPDAALARVLDMTDRLVKQPGRDTIAENVERDPARARYARIPTGAETCRFCVMLASRGAVYRSEESAGDDINRYHAHCDCQTVPVWGNELPEGYDPSRYFELYEQGKGIGRDT